MLICAIIERVRIKNTCKFEMIPPFDHNNVLPPFLGGDPTIPGCLSPYKSDIMEFCQHFAMTPERIAILKGFVSFRLEFLKYGVQCGYQWIDGSFVENVEVLQSRAPHDIDVVTMFALPDISMQKVIANIFPAFVKPSLSKMLYKVDHYPCLVNDKPFGTVEIVKYWNQLFGHNRAGIWKGMIELPLYNNDVMDMQALNYLNSL